jgi:hypothetical protein
VPAVVATMILVAAQPAEALISLTAGPGTALAPFGPDKTATGTGALTATDTNPSWTLQVEDQGAGAGKMVAAAAGCTGSDAMLANPLLVSVTSSLGGVSSSGQVSLSASNQTVASATSQTLAAATLTTNYTQVIPATEAMLAGCLYNITVTYTLQ